MTQLAEQKVNLDSTTELLRSRGEEIRAAFLAKEVEFAQLFQRSNADLQKTIATGRGEFQQLQAQLQSLGSSAGPGHYQVPFREPRRQELGRQPRLQVPSDAGDLLHLAVLQVAP